MSSNTEKKMIVRKSSVIGINKVAEDTTVLQVSKAFESFSKSIIAISIETTRNGHRNAMVTFKDVESCEKAKELGSVELDGECYELFFAQSKNSNMSLSASQTKVYVRYPSTADYDDIVKMFDGVTISKPEGAKNYFFATCNDIDHQCEIVKTYNNKKVTGGNLSVNVAIDRNSKSSIRSKSSE
ncbi:hypothetical protein GINT2_001394 [Glugoides intestinalis]